MCYSKSFSSYVIQKPPFAWGSFFYFCFLAREREIFFLLLGLTDCFGFSGAIFFALEGLVFVFVFKHFVQILTRSPSIFFDWRFNPCFLFVATFDLLRLLPVWARRPQISHCLLICFDKIKWLYNIIIGLDCQVLIHELEEL